MVTARGAQVFEACGDHMGGGWWWAMGIGWLVFLALVVVLGVVLVRHLGSSTGVNRSAHHVLDERFARGEIDEDEYRRRRDVLRS
jgi:putative membrane protein